MPSFLSIASHRSCSVMICCHGLTSGSGNSFWCLDTGRTLPSAGPSMSTNSPEMSFTLMTPRSFPV
jgi:hypothetical protein